MMFDLDRLISGTPPNDSPTLPTPEQPTWCVCTHCKDMPTDAERKCCGQTPENCTSLLPHMDLFILQEGVLRLARRIWNDVRAEEDAAEPGEANKQFRYAAYRQYVV